jgi:DNA polymerase-1
VSKLVLIDGNAILHRAYHALPPLTTREGEPINAVYGLVSMLLRIIQDLEPTHIAIAFDRKEPTFRKEVFKAYQAHRPEMDEDLAGQFDYARRFLDAVGIPIFSKAGYEADDVIGTIVDQAQKNMEEIIIVTGDQDILQLVNGKVRVFLPSRGVVQGKVYDKEDVVEKLGITPEQVIDYKALVGDPSDNYPGVKGIGPKTAEKLLKEYKTFEGVYKNIDKIEGNLKEKLINDKKNAKLSYELARIVKDVDASFDKKQAGNWRLNSKEVVSLFKEFGFKTLSKRINKLGEKIDREKQMNLL